MRKQAILVAALALLAAVTATAAPTETIPSTERLGIALTSGPGLGTSGSEVVLLDSRGVEATIAREVTAFGWSPDGTRLLIAERVTRPLGWRAWVLRVRDGRRTPLPERLDPFNAAWSPDGRRIAFERFLGQETSDTPLPVWVVGADGRGARQIATGAYSGGLLSGNVAWLPDGRHVAFVRSGALVTVTADARSAPRRVPLPFTVGHGPSWSKGGARLAVDDDEGAVWIANGNGSAARKLGTGTGAVWSPDGTRLAFHEGDAYWAVRRDGTRKTRLGPGCWCGVTWSPDSTRVAFSTGEEVVVAPAGGGRNVAIYEHQDGIAGLPLWRRGTASTEAR